MWLSNSSAELSFVTKILKLYGLDWDNIAESQKGYRNTSYAAALSSGATVNLIVYKREPEILQKIASAHYIANILAVSGMPVRQQLEPRVVQIRDAEGSKRYAALYNYLPGRTIPWEAYTQEHLKLMGTTLGHMHGALKEQLSAMLPDIIDESQALLERMQQYFSGPGVQSAMTEKLQLSVTRVQWNSFADTMEATRSLAGKRPLHMDFVRGNILFENDRLSGIIDFEKAAFGPPVFDVARSLAFLLVDSKYKQPEKVQKYFLYSGYVKRGGIKLSNLGPLQLRESLTTFFLLHDFYKFLLHNPYEFLRGNEHYIRTRNILIKRGELQII